MNVVNPPKYHNDGPPQQGRQETIDRRKMGLYKAPRQDDAITQMGVQIVTAELGVGCALLVEVDEETLKGHVQDRTTLGERQNKSRKPQTEQQEIGRRPRILRIATLRYLAIWMTHPLFKNESTRETISTNRHRALSIEWNN